MSPQTYPGIPVVAGVSHGPALPVRQPLDPADLPKSTVTADVEFAKFRRAARKVAKRLETQALEHSGATAEILRSNAQLVRDPGWHRAVAAGIAAGDSAAAATVLATRYFVSSFQRAGGHTAERATDLQDLGNRVVAELCDIPVPGIPKPESSSILFAKDLAPADVAALDPQLVAGIALEAGGPNSHSAIVARQLGIACVMGLGDLSSIEPGTQVLIDGTVGEVVLGLADSTVKKRLAAGKKLAKANAGWKGRGQTKDGHHVPLLANVSDAAATRLAASGHAEGVGLLRTEMCFLVNTLEPTTEQQTKEYREALTAFPDGPFIFRTWDVNSDKPLAFIPADSAPNPSLGLRGIRLARFAEELITDQLDAIRAASVDREHPVSVMAPMISTVDEAKMFASMCHERGLRAGATVETPAAALLAAQILEPLDFLSIGTNDLTQYTLGADRQASEVAYLNDCWNPAVLRLAQMCCEAGRSADKPVSVCGEAAADPMLACVLVGLGATSLSMSTAAIQPVGAMLGRFTLAECEAAAAAATSTSSPAAAREAAAEALAL